MGPLYSGPSRTLSPADAVTIRFHGYLDTGPSAAHEYRAIGWWAYSQSWAFPLDPGPFYLSPSSSGPSSSRASLDIVPSAFRAPYMSWHF